MAKKKAVKKAGKRDPKWVLLVARVLVAVLFIISGWEKMTNLKGTVEIMVQAGTPLANIWMAGIAGIIQLLGGLMLLVGCKARKAAGVLAIYLLVSTYFIHLAPAWKMAVGMVRTTEVMHVGMNLAILGGLLALYVAGPGKISRDKK